MSKYMSEVRKGFLCNIAKGLSSRFDLGAPLYLRRAMGRSWNHVSDVPWHNFTKIFFTVCLAFSTFPED